MHSPLHCATEIAGLAIFYRWLRAATSRLRAANSQNYWLVEQPDKDRQLQNVAAHSESSNYQ